MGVKPFRGDQVAAGAVVLAVLVLVLNTRFDDRWALGVHVGYTLAAAAGCALLGFPVRRPAGQRGPRAWETTLLVVCWLLTAVALVRVTETGPGDVEAWEATVVLLALGALGLGIALRGAGTGTFLAAASFGAAVPAGVEWLAEPSAQAFRWILLAELLAFAFLVVGHRDRRPHHAAQLANAAALAALGIAAIGAELPYLGAAEAGGDAWAVVLLAAGFGAVGFGAVDRHRGPVVVGSLVLLGFVLNEPEGTLLGWPLVLAAAATVLLVIGLRPTHELPPPPDEGGEPVAPLPLRG